MVEVAQSVRALDCGSRGRGFESRLSPFPEGAQSPLLCVWELRKTGRKADDEHEDKPFYPADIDGDRDFADYAMLAGRWQDIVFDECGRADLTGDGRLTGDDLQELAYHWLAPLEISQHPLEKSDF